MPHAFAFIFVVLFFALWSTAVTAQGEESIQLPNVEPFTPFLSINENPEICSAYETAWRKLYKSEKSLSELWLNMKDIYPNATHIYPGKNNGLSNRAINFDFDGDGDSEVLYIDIGTHWRNAHTAYYLYESPEAFETELLEINKNNQNRRKSRFIIPKDSQSKSLGAYPIWGPNGIFQIENKLYTQSPAQPKNGVAVKASLDWLRPDQDPTPICEIKLTPEPKTITSIIDKVETGQQAVANALKSIYGGPDDRHGCQRSTGWGSAPPLSKYWNALNHRPHSMQDGIRGDVVRGRKIDESGEADRSREFRYLIWGLKDPSSFQVIRDLKTAYPKFIAEYSLYYQIYFDMDKATATATAKRAYRYLLGNSFYLSPTKNQFTNYFLSDEPITHDTSLEDIAKQVVSKAINTEFTTEESIQPLGIVQRNSASQMYLALKLGLLAEGNIDQLQILSDRLLSLPDEDKKQKTAKSLMLYSLKHPALLKDYLKLGADAERSTNYFGKTPLMYAAQNDNLAAVDLLLANGANPNSATQHNGDPCKRELTRDGRTPLMYAAENATPTLIYTLIEAGADASAQDSLGNSAEWYLQQNAALSLRQKEPIIQRLR